MKIEFIKPYILFVPIILVQVFIIPLIAIEGISPDLLIILLVFFTLKNGQLFGTVTGFFFGLIFDLISGSLLGTMMFSKTLSGFIAGYFYNENKVDLYLSSYAFPMIVLLVTAIDSITLSFLTSFDLSTNIIALFFYQGLLPAVFTSVLTFIVTFFYPKGGYI